MNAAQQGRMPLACSLGAHRAGPVPRWNDGYYFSRCRRCGQDLIRTLYSGWHVPKGHRVVWSPEPPERSDPSIATAEKESGSPFAEAKAASPGALPVDPEADATAGFQGEADVGPLEPPQAPPADVSPEPDNHAEAPAAMPDGERASEAAPAEGLPIMEVLRNLQEDAPSEPLTEEDAAPAEEPGDAGAPAPPPEAAADPTTPPSVPIPSADDEEARGAEATPFAPEPVPGAETVTAEPQLPQASASSEGRADTHTRTGRASDFLAEDGDDDFFEWTSKPLVRPSAALGGDFKHREEPAPARSKGETQAAGPFDKSGTVRDPVVDNDGEEVRPSFPWTSYETPVGSRNAPWWLVTACLLVVSFGVFAFLSTRWAETPPSDPSSAPQFAQQAAPANLRGAEKAAFVTARVVNCRISPVRQARSVRKLARGEQVFVLAREEDWTSISHQGRQCWVAARYISSEQPL